ncbi:DNA cytosine methyltransferase [Segatella oulorum]|uniref:DNA cytosine methyltransferase n=1 Tax=Segatella oulorum TaxID=28136 RepID=UPI0023F33F1C|nr:DNA cytosine methyltransferase [Segatella oulorum]
MPNVIDLFAGAGGLSLGASRAGFNVISAVELESHAIATHITNFPNSRHIQRDIMELTGDALLGLSGIQTEQLDGIIGGPPCQGFSSIGHKDINDIRNTLFMKYFELVGEVHPPFFVAENVPGIMDSKYDQIRKIAFDHIRKYHLLPPLKVDASEYGAPTTRTRIFFIGFRDDARIKPFTIDDIERMKVPHVQKTTVRKALEGLPSDIRYHPNSKGSKQLSNEYFNQEAPHIQSTFFYERVTGMRPEGLGDVDYIYQYEQYHKANGFFPTKHTKTVKQRYAQLQPGQQDKISKSTRLNPDGFCPTLRAGTGPEKGSYQAVRPIHYRYARVITPREAARLQGFPDWFKLPETIWHGFRQIGNSVSPIVAERVLQAIFQKLT